MNTLVFLPFLVATCCAVVDIEIFRGRINNGIVRKPADVPGKEIYSWALQDHPELAECPDYTLKEVFARHSDFIVSLDCNGERKWATYTTTAVTREEDLAEAPVLGTMGGYNTTTEFEDELFGFFEAIKGEGCKVNYSQCASKMVNHRVFFFTCPTECDGVETFPVFKMEVDPTSNELLSIGEEPTMDGAEKMCTMKMKDMLTASGTNTIVVLKDAGLTSDVATMEVTTGSYLELATGVQYCMEVQDVNATTVISLYQFNLEGTEPFLVALPFDDMLACNYFLKKVSCQWVADGEDCAYNL